MKINKVLLRSISGLIYMAVIVGLILCGASGVYVLTALLAVIGTAEFDTISYHPGRKHIAIVCCDIICTVTLVLIPSLIGAFAAPVWLLAVMTRLVLELYCKEENPLRSLSTSFMTQVYIGVPLACMSLSAMMLSVDHLLAFPSVDMVSQLGAPEEWGTALPLIVMFIYIWLNDTGAFVFGSLFGRHKLFERISPKKTWEGFFGGLFVCLCASFLFYYFGGRSAFHCDYPLGAWIGYAFLVTVFATWGDLVESLVKRNLKIKDSGNIIPGHGGILDRIDSLLLVMPASLIYCVLVKLI